MTVLRHLPPILYIEGAPPTDGERPASRGSAAPPERTGPKVFDRLSIRKKLIAMVAAPLVVVVVVAGLGFGERRAEAATTRADVRRLEAIEANLDLQNELQLETLYSVGFLASDGVLHAGDLGAQQDRTDEALARYETSLDALGDDPEADSGRSSIRQIGFLDTSLRLQVEGQTLDWDYANQLYDQVQTALPPVNDRLASAIGDAEVSSAARSVLALGAYGSTTGRIGSLIQGVAAEGRFTTGEGVDEFATGSGIDTRSELLESIDEGETDLTIVSELAPAEVRTQLRNQMVGDDVTFFSDQVDAAADLAAGDEVAIDGARWSRATEATLDQLRGITTAQADAVLATAQARVSQSESAARLFLAAALVAIVAAVGLALYVAASIARPLTRLTRAADHVANEQLPRMVEALRNPDEDSVEHLRPEVTSLEVGGGKELARLSASVSAIGEVAVDVATEQAALLRKGIGDMFVNLARRNQALLDRQLEFIDELEAEEEDPDDLEALFKLDHMATRMRRNAESLLVLAGSEPSRRRGQPVPLSKVTLAAVGEIEHFARVDLLELEESEVTSKAAADVAHLFSELMENATQFSPPDTRVVVVGHRNENGGYTLSITDEGIGMSSDQLSEANDLLAHPPLLGLTLARTLGFIVVGRLAARHDIGVRMSASPTGGVTAIVRLPVTVLVASSAAERLDLTDAGSGAPGAETFDVDPVGASGPVPVGGPPHPSSILPPFTFGPDEPVEDDGPSPAAAPATLEEAVPSGRAFDEGLSQVASSPPDDQPTGPGEASPPIARHRDVPPAAPTSLRTGGDGPSGAPEPLPADLLTPRSRQGEPPTPEPNGLARRPSAASRPSERRLFGAGPEPVGATASPGVRAPMSGGPSTSLDAARPASAGNGVSPSPTGEEPAPEVEAPAPELTGAGLVRRVPRSSGAKRAIPGSDAGERGGATTSARSPDEVRSMLSRFHSGRQAAQAPTPSDPATAVAGPPPSNPEES